jgi:PhoH-like ATPase
MKKTFVLDTNVLLHDPYAIHKFREHNVIIPLVVVEEIDKFKRDQNEVGRNARTISRLLDKEREKGSLNLGVKLNDGGTLKVVIQNEPVKIGSNSQPSADNFILGVAVTYSNEKHHDCILVTKDTNLRIKADALGIPAQDYRNDKVEMDELYSGYRELAVEREYIDQLHRDHQAPLPNADLLVNQFVVLSNQNNPSQSSIARVSPEGDRLIPANSLQEIWGIKPLNLEQRLAMEILLDPKIKLVTLIGKAGTGKTLLAIAAGLHQVVDESAFHRLLVARPVLPLGKDLGYLPGDVDEKLKPWMQPIFDNLEFILSCNLKDHQKGQPSYQYLFDKGWLQVEPLTYMRGRSIPNQFLIVDEAQNLTPHEVKSVITRAGHNTKIILTGDPHQIDNPFLDTTTNGITYLVQRFKGQPIYGHVTLVKGERSTLAELASNLL